jgi:hypothetical protein
MADRGDRPAHLLRGCGVQRILLALHGPAGARVRPCAIALGHKPPHIHGSPGRQQMVGPLDTQTVGEREVAIEVTRLKGRGTLTH